MDELLPFPGYPGLPEAPADVRALPAFLQHVQAQAFDLVLQMHGSGTLTNPLVATFGARHSAGFRGPGAYCPDPERFIAWPEDAHEIERCLMLTDSLGVPRQGTHLDFPLRDEDRLQLQALWPRRPPRYVVMHPGSQLPSRRWPVERFARVAHELGRAGWPVVLTGTAGEADLAAALQRTCPTPLLNLTGRTDLWTLGALIEGASLLVSNDTGVSHIAAALGTPSVVVALGSDVRRWAPLDATRHRVLWHDLACRPCAHRVCPTGHECATAIGADAVLAQAFDLLQHPCDRSTPWHETRDACASSPGMCTATTSTT